MAPESRISVVSRRPALIVASLFVSGILFAECLDPSVETVLVGVLVCVVWTGIGYLRKSAGAPSILLALCVLLGALRYQDWRGPLPANHLSRIADHPKTMAYEGIVKGEVEPLERGSRVVLKVDRVLQRVASDELSGSLLVRLAFRPFLEVGDQVRIRGVVHTVDPPRNPGAFDYRTHL